MNVIIEEAEQLQEILGIDPRKASTTSLDPNYDMAGQAEER
jgi:hypothetical protein